jgi:hypothetical protein
LKEHRVRPLKVGKMHPKCLQAPSCLPPVHRGLFFLKKKRAKPSVSAKLATMPSCDCPLVLVGAAHTIEQNIAHEAKHLFRLQRRTHGLQLLTNSPSSPIQRHLYAAAAAVLRAVGSHRRDEWSKLCCRQRPVPVPEHGG